MEKIKILLVPVFLIMLISFVQAGSTIVFLFYDSTTEDSLTIYDNEQVGIVVSADSIFENSMTINVDLLDSSEKLITNLLSKYTTFDEYYNYFTFGKEIYNEVGNYKIVASVTGASGSTDTAELLLEVLEIPSDNNIPVITSTPITEINEGEDYSYQITATDADGDILTYSLTQNPDWISINSQTGLITGTAPLLDSDYEYAITVKVLDGTDFATHFFTLLVKDVPETEPEPDEDTIPPVITIISPVNGATYDLHITSLQYTAFDENLDFCEYSLDNGVTRIEVTCGEEITGLSSVEGENTWTIYATDTFGNEASESVKFNVEIEEDEGGSSKKRSAGFKTLSFDYEEPHYKSEKKITAAYLEEEKSEEEIKEPLFIWKKVIFIIFLIAIFFEIIFLIKKLID